MNIKRGFLYLLLVSASAPVFADRAGDQGVGLMIGNPSGLSYKFWLDEKTALDAAAGIDQQQVRCTCDILVAQLYVVQQDQRQSHQRHHGQRRLSILHRCGSARFVQRQHRVRSSRFPLGLSFLPHNTTWEFFGELAPVVRFTPDTGMNFDFGVGARYYFPAVRPRMAN